MTGKKAMLVLSFMALLAAPLAAQDTVTYEDLSNALSFNNTTLLAAMEDYRTAGIDVKDAKSSYHPQISYTIAGSYVYQHQPMSIAPEDANALINDMFPGLGGSIQLGKPIDLTNMLSVNAPYLNASVSLVQPIYTWGKVTSSVKMYEEIESARALQIGDTEAQLDAQLKAYLSSLYYLDQVLVLLDSIQQDADELVTIAEQSSSTGVLLQQDVASARVSASQIALSKTQVESQIQNITTALETMTGIDNLDQTVIDYTPDEAWFAEIANADRAQLELMATGNSQASIQMLDHMAAAAGYAQNAAKGFMYVVPDIALSVSADYTAPLTDRFADESAWGVTVAVALQGTIWDGGQRSNDRQRAESAVSSAQITRTEAVNTIKTTLNENLGNIDIALANIEYQKANIELLQSELELEQSRFDLGASSRQDILEKRIELGQAQVEMITQKMSLAASCFTVDYLTGYSSL